MAVRQQRLAFGTLSASAGQLELYTVGADMTTRPYLVVTNTSNSTIAQVKVELEADSTDYELVSGKIAAGQGRPWRVLEISDTRLNAGDKVKLTVTSGGPVHYFLSGTEYDVS